MKKAVWVGVSLSLLVGLQALAQSQDAAVLSANNLQAVEKNENGDFRLIGKDGSTLVITKDVVRALTEKNTKEAPRFKKNAPCVAKTKE